MNPVRPRLSVDGAPLLHSDQLMVLLLRQQVQYRLPSGLRLRSVIGAAVEDAAAYPRPGYFRHRRRHDPRRWRKSERPPRWIQCCRNAERRIAPSSTVWATARPDSSRGVRCGSTSRRSPAHARRAPRTSRCNYGRSCGTLRADGTDVGETLISESLAVPFICERTSCRQPRDRGADERAVDRPRPPRGCWSTSSASEIMRSLAERSEMTSSPSCWRT